MDPVREFLEEKTAVQQVPSFARGFGKALTGAGAAAAVGASVTGMGIAAHMLYEAATKGRDFRKMIEFNPDLASEHEKDPKTFNQLFSSLRTVNPGFSKDPIIAGTYMRRMVGSPSAGGVLTDAVSMRGNMPPSFGETVQRHALGGGSGGSKGKK